MMRGMRAGNVLGWLAPPVLAAIVALSIAGDEAGAEKRAGTAAKAADHGTAKTPAKDPGRSHHSDIPWDPASLGEKIIYGTDDRHDVYEETDPVRKALAASTCALVESSDVNNNGDGTFSLELYEYNQGGPWCPGEAYVDQPVSAFCTGFVVGPNLIATAGHCIDNASLSSTRFVFEFYMADVDEVDNTFDSNQVYTGVQVVGRRLEGAYDYAVIRVDRNITAPGAAILPLRTTGTIPLGTPIGVIGHPSGLPSKIAFGENTFVSQNWNAAFFVTNLDGYAGNSGSPVFNADTGVVEGILVRGPYDSFIVDGECIRSNELSDDAGGVEVSNSTGFVGFVQIRAGTITMDKAAYSCSDTIGLSLTDDDLRGTGSAIAELSSSGGDLEAVLLVETSVPGRFEGNVPVSAGAPGADNGTLEATEGQTITAFYHDVDNGTGNPADSTANATVDCTAPVISNVVIESVGGHAAVVTFTTNHPAVGGIHAGPFCETVTNEAEGIMATAHEVTLTGLDPQTTYRFSVSAEDAAGNVGTDVNFGLCYEFVTGDFVDYLTQGFFNFDSNLSGDSITLSPDDSPSGYAVCRAEAEGFPSAPGCGTVFPMSDDDFFEYTLPEGTTFPFHGQEYGAFFVGSNGYVTFGQGDDTFDPTFESHFALPRISGYFGDLVPDNGVIVALFDDRVAITYDNAYDLNSGYTQNLQIEMFFDGGIRITWLSLIYPYGIIGISAGDGVPFGFVESDGTLYPECAGLVHGPAGCGGGPANDTCDTATAAVVGPVYAGNTALANGSGNPGCEFCDAPDVWYSFTPEAAGLYTLSLCGSDFDTTLDIFGGDCDNLTRLAYNDDGDCGVASKVSLDAVNSATYLVRVSGSGGDTGDYTLGIEGPVVEEPGLTCDSAMPLTPGEAASIAVGLLPGEEAWYSFVPGVTGVYSIAAGVGDIELIVYSGPCESLSALEFGDSNAPFYVDLFAGVPYLLSLYNYSGQVREVSPFIDGPIEPPVNDECETAHEAVPGQVYPGSTIDALNANVWFSFTPEVAGVYSISAAAEMYKTAPDLAAVGPNPMSVTVYTGTCDALEEFDHSQLAAPLFATLSAGETYLIEVGGFDDPRGEFVFLLDGPYSPVPGDACISAVPAALGEVETGSTLGADGLDVWYSFTPEAAGVYSVSVAAGVYSTSPTVSGGMSVELFSGTCEVSVPVAHGLYLRPAVGVLSAGESYLLRLYSEYDEPSEFALLIEGPIEPQPGDECESAAIVENATEILGDTEGATQGDRWHAFTPDAPGTYSFAFQFDEGMEFDVFMGTCGALEPLAHGDYLYPSLTLSLVEGQTYLISVHSDYAVDTAYSFVVDGPLDEPGGGDCESARPVTSGTPYDASIGPVGQAWYSFSPGTAGIYEISIEGDEGMAAVVYDGICGSLGEIEYTEVFFAPAVVELVAGQTYYIAVYSIFSTPGSFSFFIDVLGPEIFPAAVFGEVTAKSNAIGIGAIGAQYNDPTDGEGGAKVLGTDEALTALGYLGGGSPAILYGSVADRLEPDSPRAFASISEYLTWIFGVDASVDPDAVVAITGATTKLDAGSPATVSAGNASIDLPNLTGGGNCDPELGDLCDSIYSLGYLEPGLSVPGRPAGVDFSFPGGADVAGFSATVPIPDALEVTSPVVEEAGHLDPSLPLSVTWVASAEPRSRVLFLLVADSFESGITFLLLSATDDGEHTFTPDDLATFVGAGNGDLDLQAFRVTIDETTVSRTGVGPQPVSLYGMGYDTTFATHFSVSSEGEGEGEGEGELAAIEVAPASYDFGDVPFGNHVEKAFVVHNTGTGILNGNVMVAAPFSVVSGATYSVAPGASHAAYVRFAPTIAGGHSADLIFTGGGGATVALSGIGIDSGGEGEGETPEIEITPAAHDFGEVPAGESLDKVFIVRNVGGGTLAGGVTASPPFSILAGGSYSIPAGSSRTATVRFSPANPGAYSADLPFTGGGGSSVTVSGEGIVDDGDEGLCDTYDAIELQLAAFRAEFGIPANDNDIDNDGLPDDALLALLRLVLCGGTTTPSKDALDDLRGLFEANLAALQAEANPALDGFEELLALVFAVSEATREAFIGEIEADSVDVAGEYVSLGAAQNVFTGGADLDGDGNTNAEEFDNLGGDLGDFLEAVDDANLGGPAKTSCFGLSGAAGGATGTRGDLAALMFAVAALMAASGRGPRMFRVQAHGERE